MTTPVIVWSKDQVRRALTSSATLGAAARVLGCAPYVVRLAAKRHGLGAMVAALASKSSRAPHSAFVDMTDTRVRNVTVHRRAENQANGNAAWFVRCDAGHEFVVQGIALRAAEKEHRDLACPDCPQTGKVARRVATWTARRTEGAREYSGTPSRAACVCSVCSESGHTRRNCPTRKRARSKFCDDCAGLAHRRAPDGCAGCGGAYAPERPKTILEAVASMRAPSREVNF